MKSPFDRRQTELSGTYADLTGLARMRAAEPLRACKAQAACDIGLFSDDASQLDLVSMANQARK